MNIRQTIIRVWLVSIVGFAFASGESQAIEKRTDVAESSHLIATLKPAFSKGFTVWEGYDNPDITYEIEVISGKSVVKTISTPKNYYKFDMVTYQNHDYRVKAIDSNSNAVIGIGPQDHISLQIIDAISMKATCTKVCNGPNYAWQMHLMQEDTPDWNINKPAYLKLTSIYEPFDITMGAPNSTWQAMSQQYYEDNILPYTYSSNTDVHVDLPDIITQGMTHYYDAFGTLMTGSTYFVQKTMAQFAYANGSTTTTFAPDGFICSGASSSSNYWIDKFNDYPHPDNMPASGVNDEATLSCTNALGGYVSPGADTPNWSVNNPAPVEFYLCTLGGISGNFVSIIPCDEIGTGNGDGPPVFGGVWIGGTYYGPPTDYLNSFQDLDLPNIVDHIEFDPLSDKGHTLIIGGDRGDFTGANSDFSSLKSGIYQFTVILKDGRGFPRYVELVNNTSVRDIKH